MLRDYLYGFGNALGDGVLDVGGRLGRMISNVPVDIVDMDDSYVVRATIAGYKKDDVRVTYKDGVLQVSGEMNVNMDGDEEAHYLVRERAHSCFNRTFSLPNVAEDEISAKMEDGILVITLPKMAEKEPNKIEIQ